MWPGAYSVTRKVTTWEFLPTLKEVDVKMLSTGSTECMYSNGYRVSRTSQNIDVLQLATGRCLHLNDARVFFSKFFPAFSGELLTRI